MTNPITALEQEHLLIAQVVRFISTLSARIEAGQTVDPDILHDVVEFMRLFADQCHHGKEEDLLFPLLVKKGVPLHGCPIEALTAEHVRGRAFVKGLAESAEAYKKSAAFARDGLIENLRAIAGLYPNHIWKEDYLLYPMANKVLSPEDLRALAPAFEQVEINMGQEVHHRFEQLVAQLERRIES